MKILIELYGASSRRGLERATRFYKAILKNEMIQMNSIEEAELVKVWENSIRNISIAESNLLAMLCDSYGFSIDRILKGLRSKTKQFKIDIAYPGIGPGGHCIPEDIQYLIKKSENDTNVNVKLLKDSVKINENMPQYLYNKLINKIVSK